MCNHFTLHDEFRIDAGKTKFEQKTDGILHACGSFEQRTQKKILRRSTWKHRVLHCTSRKRGRNIKTRCLGSTTTLLKRKDFSSIRRDQTASFFTKHSQLIVSRRLSGWKLEKSCSTKLMPHPSLLQRFPFKTIGCRNWVQKLLEAVKTHNKPNQRPKIQMLEQGDLLWQSNNPVRVFKKSKLFELDCEMKAPKKEHGDLFSTCVSVSVKRLDQDKEADENKTHVTLER